MRRRAVENSNRAAAKNVESGIFHDRFGIFYVRQVWYESTTVLVNRPEKYDSFGRFCPSSYDSFGIIRDFGTTVLVDCPSKKVIHDRFGWSTATGLVETYDRFGRNPR